MELSLLYKDSRTSVESLPSKLRDSLPRSKFDDDSILSIEKLGEQEFRDLLPFLLTWIQDLNWPIARSAMPLLLSNEAHVVPEIKWVLEGCDDQWKGNCIRTILSRINPDYVEVLSPILERIAYSPTEKEIEEDVHEDALECLEYIRANRRKS